MRITASEIVQACYEDIGLSEQPLGSNNVKYNTAYYGRQVSGSDYDWCCVFIWYKFDECNANELFYGGKKTASCINLINWFKQNNMEVDISKVEMGDIIFFDWNDNKIPDHVGIVAKVDNCTIYTIEGNTGKGYVMRKSYSIDNKNILSVCRPKYRKDEEELDISKLTDDDILELIERIRNVQSKQEPENWSKDQRKWAEKEKVVSGTGDSMGYKTFTTKEEVVAMLYYVKK